MTFCQKFLTIKIQNFDHQNWRDSFVILGWTGPYIFGYLNAKFQPVGS